MWENGGRRVRPDLYTEQCNAKQLRSVTGALTPLTSSCNN